MKSMKLYFNNEEIALLKGSYKLNYSDVESLNKSEAGTTIREMIREGVLKISVQTYADDTWVKKFAIAPGRRAGAPPVWKLTRSFPVQACKHPPAASLFSPLFGALGSKHGTKLLPEAH